VVVAFYREVCRLLPIPPSDPAKASRFPPFARPSSRRTWPQASTTCRRGFEMSLVDVRLINGVLPATG